MTLGQRIQELRKAAGLTQEGLGETLGVSRQAVSKWESDGGIPELDALIAMSRLFGVTIGQLLGVEEAAARPEEEPSCQEGNEELMEAVLRRYAEENLQHAPRTALLGWGVAAIAVVAAAAIIFGYFGRTQEIKEDISDLWDNVAQIESIVTNVRNQVGGLSESIYAQVSEALELQARFISEFSHELVAVDVENQTVTLRFDATLREYTAGSTMQILVNWTRTDETAGQTVSDFVPGPDFSTEITIPMCYTAQVVVRVADASGAIREQSMDETLYYHPESFQLEAYNLMRPFLVTIGRWSSTSVSVGGSSPYIDILSQYPESYWPVRAELTAWVNGEEVCSGALNITASPESDNKFCAAPAEGYYELTMKNGDTLQVMLRVTDNFGRTQEFWDSAKAEGGKLERTPASPVVVFPD